MRTAYIETLYELAGINKNVYALISDNGALVYDKYRERFKEQYLNLGISEANMLGMAAGMASRGKIPFAYTIGAFLAYRSLEFIRNDICIQKMNVKIVGTGAGEAYSALGPTHHATEDLGGLRSLPNLTILSPGSPNEVRKATEAAYELSGPVYLRLGTNREPEIYDEDYNFIVGKGIQMRDGNDITIVSTGSILKDVIDISDEMRSEGIGIRVLNIHTIKPFDNKIIEKAIDETHRIITVEDHNIIGGIGSATAEVIAEYGKSTWFKRIGLTDYSNGYGLYGEVKNNNGIGLYSIKQAIKEALNSKNGIY